MKRRDLLVSAIATGGVIANSTPLSAKANKDVRKKPHEGELERGFLSTEYGQIYYWATPKVEGPNVVCIHQSGNSSEEYRALIPYLEKRCRLISLDLPGHGLSDDPREEPSVEDYTTTVERVLQHLDISKSHLVGHHGGALTAINLYARQPRQFGKLILSGIGGLKTQEQTNKFIESILQIDITIRPDAEFAGNTWLRYVDSMSDGADVRNMIKPYTAFLEARLRTHRGVLVNLKWDRRPALKKLDGPILLVQGSKDKYVSGQEGLLKVLPNAERLELEGYGTFMFYDRPQGCANMIASYLEI